jgi:CheY-like chemotaxis protein
VEDQPAARVDTGPRLDEAGGLQGLSQGFNLSTRGVMRTRHSLSSLDISGVSRVRHRGCACGGGSPPQTTGPAILLVSDDTALGENLRRAAAQVRRSVVQADGLGEALRAVRSAHLAAVLLDLDLPSQGAWEIADGLLQEASCPPLILVTGRRDQFDVSTAIRAGSLVDKSASLARLLEVVEQAVALPGSNLAERNAIQRVVIRWLRPCAWSVPVTPAQSFWGINE